MARKPSVSVNGKGNGRVKVPAANGSDHSAATGTRGANAPGLTMERRFTQPGENVYETVEWETRDAVISNERGEKVFEQTNVEIPKTWTQLATNVVVSKYFRGHIGTPERETSVRQLISRVADTMADWGRKDGYFANGGRRPDLPGRTDSHSSASKSRLQLSGLVQCRACRSAPSPSLGVLHQFS